MPVKLNTGALIAGVLGTHKFVYDVWGDTVNTAKRMEATACPVAFKCPPRPDGPWSRCSASSRAVRS